MTPDKNKKPLPLSISISVPEQPSTYQQWKIALQRIKILYLRGQWKCCVARCCQLLVEATLPLQPLHATYLHFYSALSSEAIARAAHPLSDVKLQFLEQAKMSYQAAASILPLADAVGSYDTYDDGSCSDHSSSSTESEILDYYQSSPRPSSPRDDASLPSSVESVHSSQGIAPLKPPPLPIRKSPITDDSFDRVSYQASVGAPPGPPPTLQPPTPPHFSPTSISFRNATSTWLRNCSLECYNAHLVSFANMLTNHILSVETLIQRSREAQAMEFFAKRVTSHGEDESVKAADLKVRIMALKAAGWKRERFRPERYQDLCERALEEL